MQDIDAYNFALLLARVMVAVVMFAHGWRHVKALRSGPGMANWFESLGLKPGPLHAQLVTVTELVVPLGLVLGFFTPFAYAGAAAVGLVAMMTNHLKNGFFLSSAKEGYEYVLTLAVLSIALGTLGPGEWSLDHAAGFDFPFDAGQSLIITAAFGVGGAALFLLMFWRPPKRADTSS
ncbi:MAG TPA: DoxX family protein [Acidimicrobiia bacterium]